VAECAQPESKCSGWKTHGAAILSGECTALKRREVADGFAGERFSRGALDVFKRSGGGRKAARLGLWNGRRCRGLLRKQEVREMTKVDYQLYMV